MMHRCKRSQGLAQTPSGGALGDTAFHDRIIAGRSDGGHDNQGTVLP